MGTAGAGLARIFALVWSDFSLGRHLDQFVLIQTSGFREILGNYWTWSPSGLQD